MIMEYSMEQRLFRLESRAALENLVGKYLQLTLAGRGEEILDQLWSRREDVCIEIGASGPYRSREKVATYYQKDLLPGKLSLAYAMDPVLEIAQDGQSARGLWLTLGTETDAGELGDYQQGSDPEREMLFSSHTQDGRGYTAEWSFQKLGIDFSFEEGEWRILHLHLYDIMRAPFDQDWVRYATGRFATDGMRLDALFKSNLPFPEDKPPENLATGPTQYHWQYTVDGTPEPLPKWPQPYETLEQTQQY
jgi:hypothetical protein